MVQTEMLGDLKVKLMHALGLSEDYTDWQCKVQWPLVQGQYICINGVKHRGQLNKDTMGFVKDAAKKIMTNSLIYQFA